MTTALFRILLLGAAYQRNDGRVYVRRLGSSRPADPHEIQQLVNKPDSSPGQHAFDAVQGFR